MGGRDFVSHIIQTLFTDHSFTPSFATEEKSDNQLKKRKDNALNEFVINEQKKPHVSNTPLRVVSRGFARPCFLIIINAFDFCQK